MCNLYSCNLALLYFCWQPLLYPAIFTLFFVSCIIVDPIFPGEGGATPIHFAARYNQWDTQRCSTLYNTIDKSDL